MHGPSQLVATLLYGAGLRLLESLQLRLKDIDFERQEVLVRDPKGRHDRRTLLPDSLAEPLHEHIRTAKRLHERDLSEGGGRVALPAALARKYPAAGTEWAWQWVFPATRRYWDRNTGEHRRHHLHETVIQRAFKTASAPLISPSPQVATPCATVSPRTFLRTATTSAPSRSCSVVGMSPRR